MARCCRVTDPESGIPYYLSASFRRNEADNDDVFDLEVTDFRHAWVAKGDRRGAFRARLCQTKSRPQTAVNASKFLLYAACLALTAFQRDCGSEDTYRH